MTRHDHEKEHSIEASASSHSYNRSESSVCVDGVSDGPTNENVPDVDERLEGAWRQCLQQN